MVGELMLVLVMQDIVKRKVMVTVELDVVVEKGCDACSRYDGCGDGE